MENSMFSVIEKSKSVYVSAVFNLDENNRSLMLLWAEFPWLIEY